jgi:hypothetical protein
MEIKIFCVAIVINFLIIFFFSFIKEAKKKAAGEMLEKLTSSGPVVAHALVFAGVGNAEQGVTGNGSNGSRSDPKEDELGDLKVETLTPRHSKHIQQFYKNLNVEVNLKF